MSQKSLLQAAKGLPTKRKPIWFLRQAGRYLPEYRKIRAQYEFLDLCQNPKLAAEITLQPLRRFDLDAAIIFSDILIPAVALGQKLTFAKDHGPQLSNPIRDADSLSNLQIATAQKAWNFVGEAIVEAKKGLASHQTMIGFAGAPFTLGTYMIEGEGSSTLLETKRLIFSQRALFKQFMLQLAEITIAYLQMQIQAGAEVVMLFDTWAHQLAPVDFQELVSDATQCIIQKISKEVPIIYYPGQGSERLYGLAKIAPSVVAVDWRTSLTRAQTILSEQNFYPCLQGNLDPLIVLGDEKLVRARTRQVLVEAKAISQNHIFNVGHGLLPVTPIEALEWLVDEIRSFENV